MESSLPILACLAWLCLSMGVHAEQQGIERRQAASQHAAAARIDSISGNALLRQVSATLNNQPSIAAKVRHKVDLLGQGLFGSGIYLQQGRGAALLLRLDLTLQTAGQPSFVQHVCDGSNLWINEQVGGRRNLSRVDVARLRRAQPKAPSAPLVPVWVALGGLPKLVATLEESFDFGGVTKGQLDRLSVWTLEGQWRTPALAKLPEQKGAIDGSGKVDAARLGPNFPDRVVLYVGCDDLFPYRFEYWRRDSSGAAAANDRGRLLVVMELYEVRLGGALDPGYFVFQPGVTEPADLTQSFLDRFGLEEGGAPTGTNQTAPARR